MRLHPGRNEKSQPVPHQYVAMGTGTLDYFLSGRFNAGFICLSVDQSLIVPPPKNPAFCLSDLFLFFGLLTYSPSIDAGNMWNNVKEGLVFIFLRQTATKLPA